MQWKWTVNRAFTNSKPLTLRLYMLVRVNASRTISNYARRKEYGTGGQKFDTF